jgi:hypothetical protein
MKIVGWVNKHKYKILLCNGLISLGIVIAVTCNAISPYWLLLTGYYLIEFAIVKSKRLI